MKGRVFLALSASVLLTAASRSWTEGVPVQLPGSAIEILTVTSNTHSDFDPYTRAPGPIFFGDCLSFANHAHVAVTHVQFIFVGVNDEGMPKREALPLDVHSRVEPRAKGESADDCRFHVYPNGDRGFWLVARVNEADFADGTSWHAPPAAEITSYIRDALPRE